MACLDSRVSSELATTSSAATRRGCDCARDDLRAEAAEVVKPRAEAPSGEDSLICACGDAPPEA